MSKSNHWKSISLRLNIIGWIMASKDLLMLETWKYVLLYGKRDFADLIGQRILRWGNYSGLSSLALCNQRYISIKNEREESSSEKLRWLKQKSEWSGVKSQNRWQFLDARKGKTKKERKKEKIDSPRALRRNIDLPTVWFQPSVIHFELLISRTVW